MKHTIWYVTIYYNFPYDWSLFHFIKNIRADEFDNSVIESIEVGFRVTTHSYAILVIKNTLK